MDAAVTPFSRLPAWEARMLAVETLLADPEALGDDVLESCLYLLRDRLRHPELANVELGMRRRTSRQELCGPYGLVVGLRVGGYGDG